VGGGGGRGGRREAVLYREKMRGRNTYRSRGNNGTGRTGNGPGLGRHRVCGRSGRLLRKKARKTQGGEGMMLGICWAGGGRLPGLESAE